MHRSQFWANWSIENRQCVSMLAITIAFVRMTERYICAPLRVYSKVWFILYRLVSMVWAMGLERGHYIPWNNVRRTVTYNRRPHCWSDKLAWTSAYKYRWKSALVHCRAEQTRSYTNTSMSLQDSWLADWIRNYLFWPITELTVYSNCWHMSINSGGGPIR